MFMRGAIRSGLVLGAVVACLGVWRAAAAAGEAAGEAAGLPAGALQAEAVGSAESGHVASTAGGEAPAEGAGHGQPDLNPLDWKTDLALWSGAVFVALLFVLGKFAWGPIADGLDKREERIAGEIAAAEKANTDARSLLADYQGKLASADAEIRQMIEKAKREAEQAGQKIVERARGEAEAEKRRAIADIELATAGALEDLASRSATLAVQLAGKIVRAELTPADHSALVDEAVAEFSRFEPGKN